MGWTAAGRDLRRALDAEREAAAGSISCTTGGCGRCYRCRAMITDAMLTRVEARLVAAQSEGVTVTGDGSGVAAVRSAGVTVADVVENIRMAVGAPTLTRLDPSAGPVADPRYGVEVPTVTEGSDGLSMAQTLAAIFCGGAGGGVVLAIAHYMGWL